MADTSWADIGVYVYGQTNTRGLLDNAESKSDWVVVEDYPKYEIDGRGCVRNIRTQKVLKPHTTSTHGDMVYLFVAGYENKCRHKVSIRELYLKAYGREYDDKNPYVPDHSSRGRHKKRVVDFYWRVIRDFPIYEINRDGFIREFRTKKPARYFKRRDSNGALAVCVLLRQNGTKRMVELNEILMTNKIKIRPRE